MVKLYINGEKNVFAKVEAENNVADTIETGILTPYEVIQIALSFMRDEEGLISSDCTKRITDMF